MTPISTRRMTMWCAALSIALGAAWALSPLTIVAAILAAALVAAAGSGLLGRERRMVVGTVVAGLLLRGLAVLAVFLTTSRREQFHALFGDGYYVIQRSLLVLNILAHRPVGPMYLPEAYHEYGGSAYPKYLAFVQLLFGPSPYAIVLLSILSFMAASVLLHSLARRWFGPVAATGGLVVLTFWPTLFVWSVSMLKESIEALLGALIVAAGVELVRRDWPHRFFLASGAACAAALLLPMRSGSLVVPIAGVLASLAVWGARTRPVVMAALVVTTLLAGATLASRPSVQARALAEVRLGASRHLGQAMSLGVGYKVADDRFYIDYPQGWTSMTWPEGGRFLIRAALAYLLVPLPWQLESLSSLAILPQQLAWYTLVVLAVAGGWVGLRRAPLLTAALTGCCLGGMALVAPNSGNIGTLVRHRDIIVPFVVWLSALGAVHLISNTVQDGPSHGAC
jgi:hypothetical protein